MQKDRDQTTARRVEMIFIPIYTTFDKEENQNAYFHWLERKFLL
jgi:hypothetical protein